MSESTGDIVNSTSVHWLLWYRGVDTMEDGRTQTCRVCGVLRDAKWFHPVRRGQPELSSRCRPCCAWVYRKEYLAFAPILACFEAPTEKWCYACRETLPIDKFTRYPLSPDGYKKKCRGCLRMSEVERIVMRSTLKKNNTLLASNCKERVCSHCGICKPSDSFFKTKNNNIGFLASCKQCYKLVNSEKIRSREVL